jgi:hypothetical protein
MIFPHLSRKERKQAKRGRYTWTLVRVLKFGFASLHGDASSKGAFVLQDFSRLLLGCYVALIGSWLPRQFRGLNDQRGTDRLSRNVVNNYQVTPRNIPEERMPPPPQAVIR